MGDVSGTNVQTKGDAFDFPIVVFLTGMEVPVVHLDTKTATPQLFGYLVGGCDRVDLEIFTNHGANHDLERSNLWGHDEPVFITMHAYHRSEKAFRHAVRRLMAMGLLGVQIFVGHIKRLCPLISIMVARGDLEGSAVGHDRIDADRVPGAWERVPNGTLRFDDREAQIVHETVHDFKVLCDLSTRILFVNVSGVGFKKVDFTDANERTGLLGFVPKGVDHLVDFERQVLVGANPKREHRVHRCL